MIIFLKIKFFSDFGAPEQPEDLLDLHQVMHHHKTRLENEGAVNR
jgi:hypothetical protein